MKIYTMSLMMAGLLGCASTPEERPLRAQAEAPPPKEVTRSPPPALHEDDLHNCDFNMTTCVRPAPRSARPEHD